MNGDEEAMTPPKFHVVHWVVPSQACPQRPPASAQSSASHSPSILGQKQSGWESREEA